MIDDLIKREWLEDAFDNLCCHNCKMCRNFRIEDSFYKCTLIDIAPAVDTTEQEEFAYNEGYAHGLETKRPQGEWEDYSVDFYRCPECGYLLNKDCPHCQNKVILPKGGAE